MVLSIAFLLPLLALHAAGTTVEFFKNDELEHVLPVPPSHYPEALQGMIWMDQMGYYGFSNIPGGAPDGALSFGDPAHLLDKQKRSIQVNTMGPAWQWMNNAEAYKMYSIGGEFGYHYLFEFNNNYTAAQIYPYVGPVWVPSVLVSFTMELQTPPPGACPPSPNASKTDVAKCAKWHRISKIGGSTYHYYAFEIVNKDGNRVEPYYTKYLEWMNQHAQPDEQAAEKAGLAGFGDVATQSGTSFHASPKAAEQQQQHVEGAISSSVMV